MPEIEMEDYKRIAEQIEGEEWVDIDPNVRRHLEFLNARIRKAGGKFTCVQAIALAISNAFCRKDIDHWHDL